MTNEEKDMIDKLLYKINKVTAYYRHGNKIPQKALTDLSNFQIDFENWFKEVSIEDENFPNY